MQKHFSKAMEKIEGLINIWSAPSSDTPSQQSGKLLVAVSGGVDSMCLADLFLKNYGPELFALAHCNFHLRAEESDGDESLVRSWAEANGVVCHVKDFDTEAYAIAEGISIEMSARDLRYCWFGTLCEEHGYTAVAVAHNANDNAETLVLNMLRGTGLKGLSGMSLVSSLPCYEKAASHVPILIRPILECSRKMIEGYAFVHKLAYREDSTNASCDYKRNRIRNEVFPIFEKINPSFVRTLNREMGYFSVASEIVEDYCAQQIATQSTSGSEQVLKSILLADLLSHKHWRYLLYYMLEPYGFNSATLASIEALLESDRTVSGKRFESDTHVLLTGRGELKILPKQDYPSEQEDIFMPVRTDGIYHINGLKVNVETLPWPSDIPLKQPEGVLLFDADKLTFPFALRRWLQGDWFIPFGMKGKKKVSDYFADLKYDAVAKSSAVMIADCNIQDTDPSHIAAVLGLRIDDRFKITKTTTRILRITTLR